MNDHFINFKPAKYNPVSEQGNMLIITYDTFYNAMIPFVQWKNLKGIPTEMVNVSTIGNANAIKTYIANYYNTKGLTFVLLVGDAAQVPTIYQVELLLIRVTRILLAMIITLISLSDDSPLRPSLKYRHR